MIKPNTIIVTRHPALVDYLIEMGLATKATPVFNHATPETVRDRHVLGVLPLWLAALTITVTEIPLVIPADLRGQELSLEQLREFAGTPQTYTVRSEA